jgi:[protein-PII] uridylyltransferase
MSEAEIAKVEFLVRQHLVLAHLSQRRDLEDRALIAELAQKLGDVTTLRQLYLLSFADMAMVAPQNLTEWKATLLRDLYLKAKTYLRSGPDLMAADTSAALRRRKRAVAAALGGSEEELGTLFASLPDRYFAQHPPGTVARHVRLARDRAAAGRPVALDVRHNRSAGYSVVTVCAADVPGLLAAITGVLVAHRIDVHAAQIHSRTLPDGGGEAWDVFVVHDRLGRAIVDAPRWQQDEADLERVVRGELTVPELLERRREKGLLPPRVTPRVLTEVAIDNDVSAHFTVVDVYTQDRLGVLHTIARTLTDEGLDIHISKVATEAERVADVFYVQARDTGGKITAPARLEALRHALETALARLE